MNPRRRLAGILLLGAALLPWHRALGLGARRLAEDGRPIRRIGYVHWHLEAGFEEGFDAIMRSYMERHPGVEVRQLRVSGVAGNYNIYITTKLLGDTAPDLANLGREPHGFLPRYYYRLDRYIEEPNPYNEGTSLEGVPWRETFVDHMQGAYREEYLSYFGIPKNIHTRRVYYNKDLFREILGTDLPPADFSEFISYSRRIRDWAALPENRRRNVVPIAAIGAWTSDMLVLPYLTATTASILRELDINRNGRSGILPGIRGIDGEPDETFFAVLSGRVAFDNPYARAAFRMVDEVKRYFQEGFMAYGWDDGKFLFAQGQAAMMPTGTWETMSLLQGAEEAGFEMGAFPFPLPGPDHPEFGRFVAGPASEIGPAGGEIGIYRGTRHFDVALDFLRYLTSQEQMAVLAAHTLNYPAVWGIDVEGTPELQPLVPFRPEGDGFSGGMALQVGARTRTHYARLVGAWLNGEIPLDEFLETYRSLYVEHGLRDIEDGVIAPYRRQIAATEREIEGLFLARDFERPPALPAPAGDGGTDAARARRALRREAELMENQLNNLYDWAQKREFLRQIEAGSFALPPVSGKPDPAGAPSPAPEREPPESDPA